MLLPRPRENIQFPMDTLSSLSLLDPRTFIVFLGGATIVWYLRGVSDRWKRNPRRLPLPPGPKGLPVVGNLLQMPTVQPWKGYAAMTSRYGGLVYLDMLGQGILVVGSLPQALELLEKGAVSNSNRPPTPALELIDTQWAFPLMPYGAEWKKHRRAFHQYMNHNAVANYHPIMYEETAKLLRILSKDPEDFFEHVITAIGTIILLSAYGFDDAGEDLPKLLRDSRALVDEATHSAEPGNFLVNIFPILKYVPGWFPGAAFQTQFGETAILSHRVLNSPFESAKLDAANGRRGVHPSMAKSLIESLQEKVEEEYADQEYVARAICASSYAAGAETTASSCIGLVYALATHPEVRKKAQAELDDVVGPNRLPNIGDRASLPYVQAIVKEIGRWYTVSPLALPHSSTEDGESAGYFIPKETVIVANSWAIMHDPEVFERPFEFLPERYIKDGKIDTSVPDAEIAAFGYGRRKCPGRYFSNDIVFLFAASLLSAFDITPPKDATGKPLPIELEVMSKNVAKPLPFKCDLTLRVGREGLLN